MSDHSVPNTTCDHCESYYPDLIVFRGDYLCPDCYRIAEEDARIDDANAAQQLRYITGRRLHEVRYKLTNGNPPPTLQAAYEATLAAWTEVEQVLGR